MFKFSVKKLPGLIVVLLSAAKLITDSLGMPIISNDQINTVSNCISSAIVVVGLFINWFELIEDKINNKNKFINLIR